MSNKLHDIFSMLTFIGTGEHLPSSGTAGDVFATTDGKSYVYINHGWEEMGTVSHITYDIYENENEEYITQGIICIK